MGNRMIIVGCTAVEDLPPGSLWFPLLGKRIGRLARILIVFPSVPGADINNHSMITKCLRISLCSSLFPPGVMTVVYEGQGQKYGPCQAINQRVIIRANNLIYIICHLLYPASSFRFKINKN